MYVQYIWAFRRYIAVNKMKENETYIFVYLNSSVLFERDSPWVQKKGWNSQNYEQVDGSVRNKICFPSGALDRGVLMSHVDL